MSIGSSIDYSVPSVGSTVGSLVKIAPGKFKLDVTVGGQNVALTLDLQPGVPGSSKRNFGARMAFRTNLFDAPGSMTKGRLEVTLSSKAIIGSDISESTAVLYTRYFLGMLLKSGLLEDLADGSIE